MLSTLNNRHLQITGGILLIIILLYNQCFSHLRYVIKIDSDLLQHVGSVSLDSLISYINKTDIHNNREILLSDRISGVMVGMLSLSAIRSWCLVKPKTIKLVFPASQLYMYY